MLASSCEDPLAQEASSEATGLDFSQRKWVVRRSRDSDLAG